MSSPSTRETQSRLPLANAVLSAWVFVECNDLLQGLWNTHRSVCYTRKLLFTEFAFCLGLLACHALRRSRCPARNKLKK